MQAIFDMFDERVQEINLYFEAIKELDRNSNEDSSTEFSRQIHFLWCTILLNQL